MSFENPGINGVQALLGKDDTMGLMEIQKKGRFIVLQSLGAEIETEENQFGDKTLPSGKDRRRNLQQSSLAIGPGKKEVSSGGNTSAVEKEKDSSLE